MKTSIEAILNEHEQKNPHDKGLHDAAVEDLFGLNEVHPSRPFALHIGATLDGHNERRPIYQKNYDHGLIPEDKNGIDHEIMEVAELVNMLSHPSSILDVSDEENLSENRSMARDVLKHLSKHKAPDTIHESLMKELYRPMHTQLLDNLMARENPLHEILAPAMVQRTEHPKEDYSKLLKSLALFPVIESYSKGKWKDLIQELFKGESS